MNAGVRFLIGFLLCFNCIVRWQTVNGQRLRDNMYEVLYDSGACYKRYNGTHEIGCTSKFGGTVGIVHVYNDDIDWILDKSNAGPYAVVLPIDRMEKDLMLKLIARPDKIAGILVINNGTKRPESFSHQQRCPNAGSQAPWKSLQCSEDDVDLGVWNPWGSGLMYLNYPFPMFYMPPEWSHDIEKIYQCYYKFNAFDVENQAERSLCAVEMDSFMYGAVNTAVCMRRTNISKHLSLSRYCDPLGDKSVYTTLFARSSFQELPHDYFSKVSNDVVTRSPVTETDGSVALVTAAMDGTSFFDSDGVNAIGTVSGMVILMAANQMLHRIFSGDDSTDYGKNVLFVLLNGEAYDYIGSQRMAWELNSKQFLEPAMDLRAIGPHIHIGQFSGKSRSVHAFTPDYKEEEKIKTVDQFLSWMNSSKLNINTLRGVSIPPSSVHSFLRILNTTQTNLSSVVLADHGSSFDNKFYQSLFDDKTNMGYKYLNVSFNASEIPADVYPVFPDEKVPADSIQAKLAEISTALGAALYQHVTGKVYDGNITASSYIIDELIHCFLDTMACRLVNSAFSIKTQDDPYNKAPAFPMYVGVDGSLTKHAKIVMLLTGLLTGRAVNRTTEECKSEDQNVCWYTWMNWWNGNGTCIRTYSNYLTALSPAFEIEDYDFSSGLYSTWSESVWSGMSLRLLVKPPHKHEAVILSIGIIVMLISTVLVAICTKHIASLQPESTQTERVGEGDESVTC